MRCLVFLLCVSKVLVGADEPSVIIVGAGAAGFAAALKLLENGFKNVTILEAEDRVGGRIYGKQLGEHQVDMGAQWVRGEQGNVIYELAAPFGVLSHSMTKEDEPKRLNVTVKFYGSDGEKVSAKDSQDIFSLIQNVTQRWLGIEKLKTGSVGEYLDKMFELAFDGYTEMSQSMKDLLMNLLHLAQIPNDADYWYSVSAKSSRNYKVCEGNQIINWKHRSYSFMLDLLKWHAVPVKEVPILKKTLFNKKITKIKYGGNGPSRVITSDGSEYSADHVIFTPSLGVLKAKYKDLFEPSLSDKKINSIKNLGMSYSGKICLYYKSPWWTTGEDIYAKLIFWSENDRNEIENDLKRSWMLSIYAVIPVEYKPNLLCLLLSGPKVKEMEQLPEAMIGDQVTRLLSKFFGDSYNLTRPIEITKSYWNTNDNFLGSYSYRSIDSDKFGASAVHLGEPVMRNGKPVVLFAGEATEPDHYATVHGAVESGWREADRLIDLYRNKTIE